MYAIPALALTFAFQFFDIKVKTTNHPESFFI